MVELNSLPIKPPKQASVICTDEQLALVAFATETIKKAGFTFICSSMKSEACYYRLGDRSGALRIAAHRFGHRSEGSLLSFPVWSCLTFNKILYKTAEAVLSEIDHAVGRYIMYPHTRLSDARGRMHNVNHLFTSNIEG